jgi:hypothetical protein
MNDLDTHTKRRDMFSYPSLPCLFASMICREVSSSKPPLHMSRTEQGIKDWDEVEVRMRVLVRLERVWGRSAHSSPGASTSGEERERKIFVRPDAREDGFVRTSNITKFLAACASYGMADEDLFSRDERKYVEGWSRRWSCDWTNGGV